MTKKRDADKSLKNNRLRTPTRNPEGSSDKKRSRVRYACKPELQKLLDLINLIPPDHEMKSSGELYKRKLLLRTDSPEGLEDEKRAAGAFEDYLDSFPTEVKSLVLAAAYNEVMSLMSEVEALPPGIDETEVPDYWPKRLGIISKQKEVYDQLRMMRSNLYRLTEIGKDVDKYLGKQLDVVLGVLLVEHAYLDQEGKIRRQPNRFAEIIEGVEASRIRACLICRKLFWAQRSDKWCCSKEHASVIRQRQARTNKREKGTIYAKFAKRKRGKQTVRGSNLKAERHHPKGE